VASLTGASICGLGILTPSGSVLVMCGIR